MWTILLALFAIVEVAGLIMMWFACKNAPMMPSDYGHDNGLDRDL